MAAHEESSQTTPPQRVHEACHWSHLSMLLPLANMPWSHVERMSPWRQRGKGKSRKPVHMIGQHVSECTQQQQQQPQQQPPDPAKGTQQRQQQQPQQQPQPPHHAHAKEPQEEPMALSREAGAEQAIIVYELAASGSRLQGGGGGTCIRTSVGQGSTKSGV
eukprot:3604816-Amphidinium_carterae.1